MSAPTFSILKGDYTRLWSSMEIRDARLAAADAMARKVLAGKARYQTVELKTGVPWYVIGLIHAMEASLSWATHLHNGDPLTARTRQVPAGRPKSGSPPFTWEVSAIDALTYDGLTDVTDWSVERIAYTLEGYNGWGYRIYHPDVLSPYLWSFSAHYARGKYAADGKWDANLVSQQCGAMVLLARMMVLDASIAVSPADEAAPASPASPAPLSVRQIQSALVAAGYSLKVDGAYGPLTKAAYEDFAARLNSFAA